MSGADPRTLLEALARALRACAAPSSDAVRPAAILWTDPERQWLQLRALLQAEVPELLVLGDYDTEQRTGPAIWLRCVIDGALAEPMLPADRPPILLLPGIGRQQLRAGHDCPVSLQPLVELMYRGTLWLQAGGHDWTVSAFLTSKHGGLGLDVAKDNATRDALVRALPEVAVDPIAQLRGRRLEADDFDRLLSSDVIRDVLRWMSDPGETRERMSANEWAAYRNQCRERLNFDPERQADVVAGERTANGEGAWDEVWERYEEAPGSYPGVARLLGRSRPAGNLTFQRERWPDLNDEDEAKVRESLTKLPKLAHEDACDAVMELERRHSARRDWVWARLGRSPMAEVLSPLNRLADVVRKPVGGSSLDEYAAVYVDRGWQGDAAAWEALAVATTADEQIVGSVVRQLMLPWLEDSARTFQALQTKQHLPGPMDQGLVRASDDECILFADGLRYDVGRRLVERLEARGLRVDLRHRWAAAPTVTATAKPAVTPVADRVRGKVLGEDFLPELVPSGDRADAKSLRGAMEKLGYQILGSGSFDAPLASPARGWIEAGEIDTLGHKLGVRLARQLDEELDRLCEKVEGLLECGWRSVRVVTDHGWLLVPGGLPKVDLPKHLTASRWARCAVISGESQPGVPRHAWTWNPLHSFAFAPGVACFNKTEEYAHGGLSIQECLIPDLTVVRSAAKATRATIMSVTWRGLRCFVEASVSGLGIRADLRLGSPSGASTVAKTKSVEADGSVSLVLAGDEHEQAALVLVLVDDGGQVLAQKPTRVGADS